MSQTGDYGPKRRGADAAEEPLTIAQRKQLAEREPEAEKAADWLPDVEPPADPEDPRGDDAETEDVEPEKRKPRVGLIIAGSTLVGLIIAGCIIVPKMNHSAMVEEYRQSTAELQTLTAADNDHRIAALNAEVLTAVQAPEALSLKKQLLAVADSSQIVTADQARELRDVANQIGLIADQAGETDVPKTVDRQHAPAGGWLSVDKHDFGDALAIPEQGEAKMLPDAKISKRDVEQADAEVRKLQKQAESRDDVTSPYAKPLAAAVATLKSVAEQSKSEAAKAALTGKSSTAEIVTNTSTALVAHAADLKKRAEEAKESAESESSDVPAAEHQETVIPSNSEPEYTEQRITIPPEDVDGDYKQWAGDTKWKPEYTPPAEPLAPEPEVTE